MEIHIYSMKQDGYQYLNINLYPELGRVPVPEHLRSPGEAGSGLRQEAQGEPDPGQYRGTYIDHHFTMNLY